MSNYNNNNNNQSLNSGRGQGVKRRAPSSNGTYNDYQQYVKTEKTPSKQLKSK